MLDIVTEPVKKTIKKRLDSTFYSSYLIALLAINWRAVYFLFFPVGDMGAEGRLDWIDAELFWSTDLRFAKLLLGPLLFAILATTIFPWILTWIDKFRYAAIVYQKNRRMEEDIKLLQNQRQIQILQERISNQETEAKELLSEKEALTKSLNDEREKVKELTSKFEEAEKARVTLFKANLRNDPLMLSTLKDITEGKLNVSNPQVKGLMGAGLVKEHNGSLRLSSEANVILNNAIRSHNGPFSKR